MHDTTFHHRPCQVGLSYPPPEIDEEKNVFTYMNLIMFIHVGLIDFMAHEFIKTNTCRECRCGRCFSHSL